MSIKKNIEAIKEKMDRVMALSGNKNVRLIAVSKKHLLSEIKEAYNFGLRDFGENQIQEAIPKILEANFKANWHMIGHLQSNKANKATTHFDWIQSVDKLKTAQKISAKAMELNKTIKTLIEVNTSGEDAKNGISPTKLLELVEELEKLPNINPMGLMTIGPLYGGEAENRKSFSLLRNLLEKAQQINPAYKELSMGMSGDFEDAIMEGSTMVRIGSAIFGVNSFLGRLPE